MCGMGARKEARKRRARAVERRLVLEEKSLGLPDELPQCAYGVSGRARGGVDSRGERPFILVTCVLQQGLLDDTPAKGRDQGVEVRRGSMLTIIVLATRDRVQIDQHAQPILFCFADGIDDPVPGSAESIVERLKICPAQDVRTGGTEMMEADLSCQYSHTPHAPEGRP